MGKKIKNNSFLLMSALTLILFSASSELAGKDIIHSALSRPGIQSDIILSRISQNSILIISCFLLIILLTFFVTFLNKKYQRSKLLQEQQKQIIKEQKEEIRSKSKEITAGIIYARRIQSAILPGPEKIKRILPKHFVYHKPMDIVSGDFYWIERRAKKVMFAAVDCTGHGVPGALMSIIAFDGLNRAISDYEITKSDKIVNALNDSFVETLRNTGSVDVKDAIDIALCVLNTENLVLEYSGAKNPVYIIRQSDQLILNKSYIQPKLSMSSYHLFEVAADRMSIEPSDKIVRFTPNRIELKPKDRIYIFSDGFPDQFGGEKGKKLSYRKFRELLINIQTLSMDEQKNQLDIELEKWQKNYEQIDDILIIGAEV